MRQTKWAFELKRLGKFLHLLFLKPINFKILELSIKYIKKSMIQISEWNQKKHYFYCSY